MAWNPGQSHSVDLCNRVLAAEGYCAYIINPH